MALTCIKTWTENNDVKLACETDFTSCRSKRTTSRCICNHWCCDDAESQLCQRWLTSMRDMLHRWTRLVPTKPKSCWELRRCLMVCIASFFKNDTMNMATRGWRFLANRDCINSETFGWSTGWTGVWPLAKDLAKELAACSPYTTVWA